MGLSKTEEFTKTQNDIASLAKALGHPARIAILQFLSQKKGCVCGDIVDELPLSQSTVSQHLKELKKVGLIKGDIEGPSICYCIDPKAWAKAQKALTTFFETHTNSDCC
jgi:DNA-binding transcriptional ArsR family regulator